MTTPQTIPPQSAVAFFFGETLHKTLKVPVGLINSSWGGTGIEPWTPAGHPDDLWMLQNFGKWNRPQDVPTVLWNGMVAGLVPFAIKGAIWYQGCHNMRDGAVYTDKTVSLVRGWPTTRRTRPSPACRRRRRACPRRCRTAATP